MSNDVATFPTDHIAPAEALQTPPPLVDVPSARTRTPAEEARALVAGSTTGTLATLSQGGEPWASLVAYASLADGTPVIRVSTLAEHGRNLHRDPRASLVVASTASGDDPLDAGRVTLAGSCIRPDGDLRDEADAAFVAAVPMARHYSGFGDFDTYVLDIQRVRWVGGYGRMDSADADSYHAAEPDPTVGAADRAVRHLNEDHADALLLMAQHLGGFTDATAASCRRCDRYGLDLWAQTPRGGAPCRVGFTEPVAAPDGLRAAAVEVTRRARAAACIDAGEGSHS